MGEQLAPDRWPDLADQDILPAYPRRRMWAVRTLGVTALIVACCYLTWRIVATVPGATWWLAWPLIVLEAHSILTFCLYVHVLWKPSSVPPPEPVRTPRQTVSIVIPTYNEPIEVLLPTVAAAAALPEAESVWLLDDGGRDWVRHLAEQLGVHYRARPTHEHAKAGNINEVLPELTTELMAVLDADHVVRADFLANTLGYFADDNLALVQMPQSFYNTDSFEHMRSPRGRLFCEQDLFYRLLAEARNNWGGAFWCGTNSVLRLEALRQVGGVATETVTEDIHTTIRMHRRGWRTVYHNEVLARGLAASNSEQYLNQRLRWGTGAMQVLRQENPLVVSGLTVHQRLSYLSTLTGWFDAWRTLGFVLLPIATVLTGAIPASAPVLTFVSIFAVSWLVQRLAMSVLARGRAPLWASTIFEFVRMPANLKATLVLFSAKPLPFTVTDKGRTGDHRRTMPVPNLLKVLLVVSVLGAAWYAATLGGLTPVTYEIPWVAHAAALWLLFNALFLVGAAYRISSPRFGSERRAAVRFPAAGTATVDGRRARVLDVSLTGFRVVLPHDLAVGRVVAVDLSPLAGYHEVVVRSVRESSPGYVHGLEFVDMSAEAMADLVLGLFQTGSAPRMVPIRSPQMEFETLAGVPA